LREEIEWKRALYYYLIYKSDCQYLPEKIKWYNGRMMKNYSRARASRGKTAYRTPSGFRYRKAQAVEKIRQEKYSCLQSPK